MNEEPPTDTDAQQPSFEALQLLFLMLDDVFKVAAVSVAWRDAVNALVSSWPLKLARKRSINQTVVSQRSAGSGFLCRDICALPNGRLCVAFAQTHMERHRSALVNSFCPAEEPVTNRGPAHDRTTVRSAVRPFYLGLKGASAMILDSSGETLWIADGVDSLQAFCVRDLTPLLRISTGPDSGNGCEESISNLRLI